MIYFALNAMLYLFSVLFLIYLLVVAAVALSPLIYLFMKPFMDFLAGTIVAVGAIDEIALLIHIICERERPLRKKHFIRLIF